MQINLIRKHSLKAIILLRLLHFTVKPRKGTNFLRTHVLLTKQEELMSRVYFLFMVQWYPKIVPLKVQGLLINEWVKPTASFPKLSNSTILIQVERGSKSYLTWLHWSHQIINDSPNLCNPHKRTATLPCRFAQFASLNLTNPPSQFPQQKLLGKKSFFTFSAISFESIANSIRI